MSVYAHSLPGSECSRWEPLEDHLAAVAERAASHAQPFGGQQIARLAGLLHDIGKCSAEFQAYIRGERNRGVDHSTAGARLAANLPGHIVPAQIGKLVAFAIAGHHCGLADGLGYHSKTTPLADRLDPSLPIPACPDWHRYTGTLSPVNSRMAMRPGAPAGFSIAFFTRMLFSSLVDADFLETERFYAQAHGNQIERSNHVAIETLRDRLRSFMASKRRADSLVNQLRIEVLDHVIAQAAQPQGLFSLTVPTGGGKTLASLSFALEHAVTHGLRRVIYVIPFTSIIEQTADVFREALGSSSDVLEHHGSFDWERAQETDDEGRNGIAKLRRAAENWDVPVVVTTAVQFFESLFAAKPSRCRKLHNLACSVVILDEAQTLPVGLLRSCIAAIDELARNYRASVVLCTATQPALKSADEFPNGLTDVRELAPDPPRLYAALKRVGVEHLPDPIDDLVIASRFAEISQMLCIVNSRAHARALYEAIAHLPGANHLTTLMCAQHRRRVLAHLRAALRDGHPVRLVATSLMEAGVDIDFPEVWRAEAGLDSIAQAAGRCNREGKLSRGRTVVFVPAAHRPPAALRQFCDATRSVLRQSGDALGLDAVRAYFRELYWLKGPDKLDDARLQGRSYPILTAISECASPTSWNFPFASIADAFRMIDDAMEPIVVPYREGPDDRTVDQLIAALKHAERPGGLMRRLQPYAVPVPGAIRSRLIASGAVQAVNPSLGDRFVYLVSESLYDEKMGLCLDDPTSRTAEENIF